MAEISTGLFVLSDGVVMCSPGKWELIRHQRKHFVSRANVGGLFDLLSRQRRAGEDK